MIDNVAVRRGCEAMAARHNIPVEHILAAVEVESNGVVFGPDGRPIILFEPHIFYKRISGAARDEAVAEKLASKAWNKKLYGKTQRDRWDQVQAAFDLLERHGLDPNVAFECASYGVGQVLGYHWKALGFASINEFFDRVRAGAEGQIDVMMRYVLVNNLDDELRDGRWAAFARGYNGKDFRKNSYDTRMAAAAARYGGSVADPDGMLRMGSKGARVRELQALLVRAGYQVKVDGDFGPSTKKVLKSFQEAHGLTVDGIYGPETETALAEFRQGPADKPGAQTATEVDGVVKGAGTAAGGVVVADKIDEAKTSIENAIPQLQQLDGLGQWVAYGVTTLTIAAGILAIAGVVWAVWSWAHSKKTVEA